MNTINEGNSLERIVKLVLEKWYIGLGCLLFCTISVAAYFSFVARDSFQAYTTMYVIDYSDSQIDNKNADINSGDLVVNEMLAKDYEQIAISDSVLSKASDNLGNIIINANKISISAFSDTRVLKLAVITDDALQASLIANAITECLIERVGELTGKDNIRIIDKATVPQSPISVPYGTFLILAAIAGIIIDIIIILLFEIFDTKIKGPEDLKEKFNVPILALIPKYDNNGAVSTKKMKKRRQCCHDREKATI